MTANPRTVVGLDLSLRSTGVAILEPGQPARTLSIKSTGKQDATYAERIRRLGLLTANTLAAVSGEALVVLEGPSYGSSEANRSMWDRAGHWHLIAHQLTVKHCLVAVAPPTVVKKWATGSGAADKVAVALAMARLFPEVDLANSDEADALACAQIGGHRLGWQQYSAGRTRMLGKVAWPPGLPELVEAAA